MANSNHTYAKGISFNKIPKETFNTLLDQVKIIDENEYNQEAQDGFRGMCEFWNETGLARIERKIIDNKSRIK